MIQFLVKAAMWRVAVVCGVMAAAGNVMALEQTIWVSTTGNGANSGTPASPVATFQQAHDKLSPGGTILVKDSGDFGKISISNH